MVALAVLVDEGATLAGVHCHLVLGLSVHTLYDIDFTAIWPVWSGHPAVDSVSTEIAQRRTYNVQSRPRATDTAGHVVKVKNNKAMSISSIARQTNAITASSGSDIRVVDTNKHLTIDNFVETRGLGGVLVDVVDVTMSGIVLLVCISALGALELYRGLTVSKLNIDAKLSAE